MKHDSKTAKRYGSPLRVYDNGGKTTDRYTIIPPRDAGADYRESAPRTWYGLGSSADPFGPQGFGQQVAPVPGPHLGKRVHWCELPADVQKFAAMAFPAFAFDLDTIARHMCIAAVWADCDEGASPRISAAALKTARAFAEAFVSDYSCLAWTAVQADGYGSHPDAGSPAAAFGHDLYLTARGHGVGFRDREELEENDLGEKLSKPLRDDFRRWYIEPEFSRGWLYLSAPIAREKVAA